MVLSLLKIEFLVLLLVECMEIRLSDLKIII